MKKITIEKIIQLFLLSNPILDMLTAISSEVFHFDITIGIIVRVLFLVFACFYLRQAQTFFADWKAVSPRLHRLFEFDGYMLSRSHLLKINTGILR